MVQTQLIDLLSSLAIVLARLRKWVCGLNAGDITISVTTGMHLFQGLALLVAADRAAGSICMSAMMDLIPGKHWSWGVRERLLGVLLLLFAWFAIVAVRYAKALDHRIVAALLMPQFGMLVMVLRVAIVAIWHGSYADGYVPHGGGWFISSDQILIMLLTPGYLIAAFAKAAQS